MVDVNRRGFLQILGATSVAPILPANAVKAAAAPTSTSKALWASLYAKASSKAEFIGLSRNLGLSNAAIQGVSARSIGVRVMASAITNPVAATQIASPSPTDMPRLRINIKDTLEKYFWDDEQPVQHSSTKEKPSQTAPRSNDVNAETE